MSLSRGPNPNLIASLSFLADTHVDSSYRLGFTMVFLLHMFIFTENCSTYRCNFLCSIEEVSLIEEVSSIEEVSQSLLHGIFLTLESNPHFLHCRQILCRMTHQEAHLCNREQIIVVEEWDGFQGIGSLGKML